MVLVPSLVHQIVHYKGIENIDFGSVAFVASGAAHLPPELAARFSSLMPKEAIFVDGPCLFYIPSCAILTC